jgi:enterobactin synthetase component D
MSPPVLFQSPLPHGLCVGVPIEAPPGEALRATLHPEERLHMDGLPPARRPAFAAGRWALKTGLRALGLPPQPVLTDDRGAPRVAPGARASISHKDRLAVALVTAVDESDPEAAAWRIGVDLEVERPPRMDLAVRVLTPRERSLLPGSAEERWRAILLHFSMKEAIYKAVDPFVRRHLSFQDADLEVAEALSADYGSARVTVVLGGRQGALVVEAGWSRVQGHILATARARPHLSEPDGKGAALDAP